MNAFERALYADPDGDLDTLWWELVSRYQGVTPPDGRRAPDWAAKIHIAVSPVYYHTYLYGAIVGAAADRRARGRGGRHRRPPRGRALFCARGSSRPVSRSAGTPRRGRDGLAARPSSRSSAPSPGRDMSDVAPLVDEETEAEEERKTSYLELFFDLVFVFAFTQVTR